MTTTGVFKGLPYRVVPSGTRVVDAVSGVVHVLGNDSIIISNQEIVFGTIAAERVRRLIEEGTNE